jgi:P-type Cu+ transporter
LDLLINCAVNAYSKHILLKPGERIVSAADPRCIVFDKTGTLTEGALRLCSENINVETLVHQELFWKMIRETTKDSLHPVSVLLQQISESKLATGYETATETLVIESRESQPGLGQSAVFSSPRGPIRLTIGNKRMMQQNNVYIESETDVDVAVPSPVTSAVHIGVDDKYAGTIKFADKTIAGTAQFMRRLQKRDVAIYMMTGDNKAAALKVGEEVGIPPDRVLAALLPHEKAARISELEQQLGPVIMVGDNLNDAAALASASLGIVVSHESDGGHQQNHRPETSLLPVLHAGADVYLLPSREQPMKADHHDTRPSEHHTFDHITYVLDLIDETKQRINRLMKWSRLYNTISLILASGLVNVIMPDLVPLWLDLSPTTASLAMSVSSLCTLQYALQLSTWRPIQ